MTTFQWFVGLFLLFLGTSGILSDSEVSRGAKSLLLLLSGVFIVTLLLVDGWVTA
jgi:hypothetical protein